jgi:nicotinate dehydrogenase subunit A
MPPISFVHERSCACRRTLSSRDGGKTAQVPNKSPFCSRRLFTNRANACSAGCATCTFLYKRYRLLARLQCNELGTGDDAKPIHLTVDGRVHDIEAASNTALLYVLRNDLQLNGPKYGCGLGECGTGTVLMDGAAARSCVIPVSGCVGWDIVTLEKLGTRDKPDPVQQAFIDEQAAQCGYCLYGIIMTTKALLSIKFAPVGTGGYGSAAL